MREVFQKAIDGLGIKERTVIIKRYYEGKAMKQVIDNIHFHTVHNVETAEQRALKALRQDKTIQELHKAYFYTAPRPIVSTNFKPESVVVLNEDNDAWLKKQKDEIDSLEKELQTRVFVNTICDDWIQELNNELEGIV